MAVNAAGAGVVAWNQQDRIWAKVREDVGGWFLQRPIDSVAQPVTSGPRVEIARSGEGVVAWSQRLGGASHIRVGRYFPWALNWSLDESFSGGVDSDDPELAVNGWGDTAVTWVLQSVGAREVWVRIYD